MIAHYDLDDSGSANGGFFPTGCQTFRKNVRSKCNFTIVAILLSILCIVQFIILIILAVRISSGGTSGAQDLRRASSTGKLLLRPLCPYNYYCINLLSFNME